MAKFSETSNAKKGGLFVGDSHAEGGIPAIVTDTGQPIEVEGGEAIINKKATALHWEELSKINQSAGGGVPIPPPDDADKVLEKYNKGGKITNKEKKVVFDKWKKLVNMTFTELSRYYHSKEGKESGLSEAEAKEQGISSGRESAEWILKMKKTNWKKWTDDMWKWANKQISFISRMSGLKGDLTDEKGKKTRKYKALLIWGNNPKKKNAVSFKTGGDVPETSNTYAFVTSTSTTGKRLFKVFDYIPTNKEVYDYYQQVNKKIGTPIEIVHSSISIEVLSGFDREKFLKLLNEVALIQFSSKIKDIKELMFSFDSKTFNVYEFEAELNYGRIVKVKMVDGVIFLEDKYEKGGELLKRKDGSYSQRGLWDNVRANIGSGNEPTPEMLEQEELIKQKYHLGGNMSKHLAPNGNPSLLTHEEWHLVRTPAFKKWFGDWENDPENSSKVVDSNGEPLLVYHFSDLDFNVFQIKGISNGFFFTENKKDDEFSYDGIIESLDSGKVPRWLKKYNVTEEEIRENIKETKYKKTKSFFLNIKKINKSIVPDIYWSVPTFENPRILKSKYDYFDGIEFINEIDEKRIIVAFEPEQIKLADGTNTTFDGNNPDIRFDEGGKVEDLISQGVVELKMFDTKPEHAKEYGLDSVNPLYVQSLCITKNKRLKGIGNKVLKYIDDYAINNGHDVVFGHITQKAEFTKDNRETFFCDTDMIKNWLHSKGYAINNDNNDFHKIVNNDIRFVDGGLIENKYTQIIYRAILSTETTTDIYAEGEDLAKIKIEYNSISADDFDNPNSSYNSKILESRTNQFEFIGDDSLSAEDYIDNLDDTNYWDLVDEESNEIEINSVSAINKNTDNMIEEIREFLKEEFSIQGKYAEKYMTISVKDENEDFISDLNIRTADHSQNSRNNDNTSYNLSFVIANKNATEGRFIPLGEQYYYDDNADVEDIKKEIKAIIDEKIEYIKDKGNKYADGGAVQESPNKKEFNNTLMEKNKNTFSKNALKVVPTHQMKVLKSTNFSEMEDVINQINEAVYIVPKLYGQDGVKEKIIYLHYFYGNQDWYITEYDRESGDAFGYVNLGHGAELGYMSIPEIVENGKIELDFYFEPTLWSKIEGENESAFEKQNNQKAETNSTQIEIVQTSQPSEKKYIYKIDGVDYDLTNLKLDELHPIMILDTNSSQWKSAVKEYFAEQNNELSVISFDLKSYKNPYELNKAIEKWIDTNVGLIENVGKRTYSIEEKMFIRNYTGYGGLGKFGKTTVGSMFEFFTPTKVIKTMWALAYKYGYSAEKSILETSVGTGEFLQFASPNVRKLAYEINVYSAIITKILYPTTEVRLAPFEKMFIKDNYTIKGKVDNLEKFDMVIGNPPYGSFDVLDPSAAQYLLGMGEKSYTKANNYVEYFLRRSLDVLKPNGIIVMIVGAELKNGGNMFLDSKDSPVKDYLNENAILLDAYRLPDSTFERTGVTSDILVIQKK